MRQVDLDQMRGKLGTFVFKGKRYDVYQPTIGQYKSHEKARKNLIEQSEGQESAPEGFVLSLEFRIEEIRIFVPELEYEDVESMTEEQRIAIMQLIFPPIEPGLEGDKKKQKSKR